MKKLSRQRGVKGNAQESEKEIDAAKNAAKRQGIAESVEAKAVAALPTSKSRHLIILCGK